MNRPHTNALRPALEPLEGRLTPTSKLYLDFGDSFPAGGLVMTDGQLRGSVDTNAGINGPNLPYGDAQALRFTPLAPLVTFDHNADGAVTAADYTALRADVVALVSRYYATLDLDVVVAPALPNGTSGAYLQGIRDTLNLGAAIDGERDAWVFVSKVVRDNDGVSVGDDRGLYGISPGDGVANAGDDSVLVFADFVLGNGGPAAVTLAFTAAHEAGHSFGQKHRNRGTSVPGVGMDVEQLDGSELVTEGDSNAQRRFNLVFHTRFPLVTGDGNNPPGGAAFDYDDVENQYERLLNASFLGPRVGGPAFVSGTGASDVITVTRASATTASVTVEAFRDAAHTSAIDVPGPTPCTAFSYTVSTANGILIEGGLGADRIVLDAALGVPVTVRGMSADAIGAGDDAGIDELIVLGGGAATATYTPGAALVRGPDGRTYRTAQVAVGSMTVSVEEFEGGGAVEVQSVGAITVRSGAGVDALALDVLTGGPAVTGSANGAPTLALRLRGVGSLAFDLGGGNDSLSVDLGAVPGGGVTVDGGAGTNGLVINDRTDTSYGSALAPASGLVFRPTGAASGELTAPGRAVRFANVNGGFAVNGDADGSGDRDTLTVMGTDTADLITATDLGVSVASASSGALRPIEFGQTNGQLTFRDVIVRGGSEAGAGGDVVRATATDRLNLFVDGAGGAGDRLELITTGARRLAHSQGAEFGPPHTRVVQEDGGSVGFFGFEEVTGPGGASAFGLVVTAAAGQPVRALEAASGAERFRFDPFPGYTGEIRVATGDLNGDGIADVVTAVGGSGPAHVMAFDGVDGSLLRSIIAFPGYLGGVSVAVGDVDGDGSGDIVVAAGAGTRPHVMAFAADGSVVASFFAFAPAFLGGLTVSAGDVNGDGVADIAVGAATGASPHVRVVSGAARDGAKPDGEIGEGALLASFFAFGSEYRGGLSVELTDLDGDRLADLLVSGATESGPRTFARHL